ncbi:MAG: hypothetical protein LBD58_07325 [Treponema sp.]|jgi:hypothetical protein|nr:hypothetical protein [Treponema sp.]
MKMVLKVLFPFISIFFLSTPLYAIDVEGTNQFFVSKTSAGLTVYVFIYPDKFVFVSGKDKPVDKVTINFNMKTSGATDIFIAGNMFCMKQRNSLYGYDLSDVLNKKNDNNKLPPTEIKKIIEGIDKIAVIADDVIYTKSGDRKVYQWTPKDGKDEPIGIQSSSSPFYVVYNPILAQRKAEYEKSKADVIRLVSRYTGIDAKKVSAIAADASDSTTLASLSLSVEKELSKDYGVDAAAAAFSAFFVLAAVTGASSDIQGILAPLNKAPKAPSPAVVTAYYKARDTYKQLASPTALQDRKDRINAEYAAKIEEEGKKLSAYGNYEAKYNKFSSMMEKLRTDDFNWTVPVKNNQLNEFDANYGKIQNYDTLLESVPNQKAGADYASARKIFSFLLEEGHKKKKIDLNAATPSSKELLSFMIKYGKYIVGEQRKYAAAYLDKEIGGGGWEAFLGAYKAFKTKQTAFENQCQAALATAQADLEKEREAARKHRDDNLDVITGYLLNNYINSFYLQAKKLQDTSSLTGYTISNIDYNIAAASESQIQGFKMGVSVKFGDFEGEIINPDKKPCFVRPATFPFIGVTRDAVYVLASKNSVVAFDLANPRIAASLRLDVPEGVYYFVNSAQNQYMVTADDVLHRLSVSGGSVKKEKVGGAPAKSSVLVTTSGGGRDSIYIISEDGRASDENGRSQSIITIKSTNSADIFTIKAGDGMFSM